MMEFKYGLLVKGNKIIIETNCGQNTFERVVSLVKAYGLDYNTEQVLEVIRTLGYKAEYLDDSTSIDLTF
jgi:hypothetical protein